VHRTSEDDEYERLIAASAAPVVAAFKLEDWMMPLGADGQVVKTGARIAVASASDESVAVAKVLDVTRRGIKVKWTAGRTGTGTISLADVSALVRTSAAPAEKGDGDAGPKASTSPDEGDDGDPEGVTAAFNPKQLRDDRGRWIEMGATVNITGDDGKTVRRGTVTKLTSMGPQITYDDGKGPKVEIVPAAETTERIRTAPQAKASINEDARARAAERNAPGNAERARERGDALKAKAAAKPSPLAVGPDGKVKLAPRAVPVQALTDGEVTQLDTTTPAKNLTDDQITKQVEQLDELTPEERGPELNARLADLEAEANRRFESENRYDVEGTQARAEESAARNDAPAVQDAMAGPPLRPADLKGKPPRVSEEEWRMALVDRGYARQAGWTPPTAKQSADYKRARDDANAAAMWKRQQAKTAATKVTPTVASDIASGDTIRTSSGSFGTVASRRDLDMPNGGGYVVLTMDNGSVLRIRQDSKLDLRE
jgi:preprotein translocase subunit YajC